MQPCSAINKQYHVLVSLSSPSILDLSLKFLAFYINNVSKKLTSPTARLSFDALTPKNATHLQFKCFFLKF